MKTSSSYTDKNNPRHAVASSTDNAKTLPKKGASTKEGEHHSTSPVDDATGGVKHKGAEERIRFQARLLDAVGHAVIATDPQGKIIYWNRAAQELYGWSEEEVMGRSVLEVTRSEMMLERAEEIRSALMIGRGWSGEFEVRRKDGTSFMAMITDTTVYDEEGYLAAIVSVSTDITERKRAEERLRQAETRYRTLVERMPAVVYIQEIGSPDSAMYMSPQIEALTGYSPEECKDPDLRWRMVHPDDRERMQAEDEKTGEPGEVFTTEYRVLHRDGRIVWVRNESVMVEEDAGGSRYWQGFMVNITERKALGERLHYQAYHDILTGLPNRQLFLDRLEQALMHGRRRLGRKVAALFMDLDNFKVVNDSLGHEVGDLLLVQVGERLKRCLRPEDTLARFGGDEFAVLLDDLGSLADAVGVVERIIEELQNPFVLEGRELVLRASVGIALGHDRTKSPSQLLKEADTAMYRAKEEASRYRVFEPTMYEQALRRLKLENDMRRAIEAEEFVVKYQPLVNIRTGEIWGIEALIRWKHPERGLLDPSRFVPVAEETGLIVPVGEWVLEEACREAARWQGNRSKANPLVVCVNLSARQLRRKDLAETIAGVLRSTGLKGCCLCLDITETLYIEVLESNTAALDDLKRMGVRISIDDFGMGYSSLSYLKRLPADALKIDRTFVAGLGEDIEDVAIVQTIIGLAHTLGMEVIAEGVESEEQAIRLKELGCDFGQGFYFSEPLLPEAASDFLAS